MMVHGIVNLNKDVGMTSHDCVMKLRRIFETKKVGHTGTLDPDVSGVLPICIGEATKIVPYLTSTVKTYRAKVTLGFATETEDFTGMKTAQKKVTRPFTEAEIKAQLQSFLGESTQVTPLYSAVKVNGKKLYEYARENIAVERPHRLIHVFEIKLIRDSLTYEHGLFSFSFEATVSKGTYIRTLCVDLGEKMGYPAHMSALLRTKVGPFHLTDAIDLATLLEMKSQNRLYDAINDIRLGLSHLPIYKVDEATKKDVQNGKKLSRPKDFKIDTPYRVEHDELLLAIYQSHQDDRSMIKPLRGFNL